MTEIVWNIIKNNNPKHEFVRWINKKINDAFTKMKQNKNELYRVINFTVNLDLSRMLDILRWSMLTTTNSQYSSH